MSNHIVFNYNSCEIMLYLMATHVRLYYVTRVLTPEISWKDSLHSSSLIPNWVRNVVYSFWSMNSSPAIKRIPFREEISPNSFQERIVNRYLLYSHISNQDIT